MKKIIALLMALMMLCGVAALAEEAATTEEAVVEVERNYAPESGTGWMSVDIHGVHEELTYVESVRSLSGATYIFENEDYRVSIVFDRKLEAGVTMGENSINSIEVQSHVDTTSGYYFSKKSGDVSVNSEVTMEKVDEDGLWQGTFSVTVLSADRWLGDMKPGIIAELEFENGEFCFCE